MILQRDIFSCMSTGPLIPYIVTVVALDDFANGINSSVINFTRQGGRQLKLPMSI